MATEPKQEESVLDLLFELIDLSRRYARQEIQVVIERALLSPARRLGLLLAFTIVAATLFALSSIFLAVGAFQLLARLVGAAWIAYLIVGFMLLAVAIILAAAGRRYGKGNDNV